MREPLRDFLFGDRESLPAREMLATPDITADELGQALEIQRCQCTARAEPIQ